MRLSILYRRLLDRLDPRTWRRLLSGKPKSPRIILKPKKENHGVGGGNIDIGDKTQT